MTNTTNTAAAYDAWFLSQLDVAYDGMYDFGRSAYMQAIDADRAARGAAQAAPVDAAEPAQQFWAVIAHCGEGVMFEDKRDAKWTHTGQGTGSDGFGVPAIGEAFRDSYEDQPLKLVQVRVVDAARAAQKGGAA